MLEQLRALMPGLAGMGPGAPMPGQNNLPFFGGGMSGGGGAGRDFGTDANSKDPVGFIAKALGNAASTPESLYMLAGMGINTAMQNMPKLANSFMDLLQATQGDSQQDPGALATPAEPQPPPGAMPGGPPPGGMLPPGMPPPGGPPPGIPPQVLAMMQMAQRQRMGM